MYTYELWTSNSWPANLWVKRKVLYEDTWNTYDIDYAGGDRCFEVRISYFTPGWYLFYSTHGFDYIEWRIYD